jgi:hypothetical protein
LVPDRVSLCNGVGQPVETLPDVRAPDARRAQIAGPDCISHRFQVSTYSGEPYTASRARNLLSKRDCSFAERDKVTELRPEMPLVFLAESFAGRAERLAGTRACPNRSSVGPSGDSQGEGPPADAGEEMLLSESGKLMRFDFLNVALVYFTGRDVTLFDQLAEPCCGLRIVLVVVGHGLRKWF